VKAMRKEEVEVAVETRTVVVSGVTGRALSALAAVADKFGPLQDVSQAGTSLRLVYVDGACAVSAADGMDQMTVSTETGGRATISALLESELPAASAVPTPSLKLPLTEVGCLSDAPSTTALDSPRSSVTVQSCSSTEASEATPLCTKKQELGDRLYAAVHARLQAVAPRLVGDMLHAYRGDGDGLASAAGQLISDPKLLRAALLAALKEQADQ